MGIQISSVFPDGDIDNSETQDQFLISMASQNPKNAFPISSELLDFSRQINKFVLITKGETEFVHYWQGELIFVAAFTTLNSPIPEHTYHFHTFKGMNFITLNLDTDCYQIMHFFMDHSKSFLSRVEFLTQIINNSNPNNSFLDSSTNKEKKFIGAPSITIASPLKHQGLSNNIKLISSSALLNIENELSLTSESVQSDDLKRKNHVRKNKVLKFDSNDPTSENVSESLHDGNLYLSESSEDESDHSKKESISSKIFGTPEVSSINLIQNREFANDTNNASFVMSTPNINESLHNGEYKKRNEKGNNANHQKGSKIELLDEDPIINNGKKYKYLSESSSDDGDDVNPKILQDSNNKSISVKSITKKSPKKTPQKRSFNNSPHKSNNQNMETELVNKTSKSKTKNRKMNSPKKNAPIETQKVFIGNQIRLQNLKVNELKQRSVRNISEKNNKLNSEKLTLSPQIYLKSQNQSDIHSDYLFNRNSNAKPKLHIEKTTGLSIQRDEFKNDRNIQYNDSEPPTHIEISEDPNQSGHSKQSFKPKVQISNSLEISRKNNENTTVLLSKTNEQLNDRNDSRKTDLKAKDYNIKPVIRITHLVEISKYEKPKPKIRIGHLIDISLPEYEPKKRKKGSSSPRKHHQNVKSKDDSEYVTIYAEIEPIEYNEISRSPSKKSSSQRSNYSNSKTRHQNHYYYEDFESNSFDQIGIDLHQKYHQIREYEAPKQIENESNYKKREDNKLKKNELTVQTYQLASSQKKKSIATSTPVSSKHTTPKKDALTNTPEITHKVQKTQISESFTIKDNPSIKSRDVKRHHKYNDTMNKNENQKKEKVNHEKHHKKLNRLDDSSLHSEYKILSIDPSLNSTPVPYSDYSCSVEKKKHRHPSKLPSKKDSNVQYKISSTDPTLPQNAHDLYHESMQSSYGILTTDPSLVQSESAYSNNFENDPSSHLKDQSNNSVSIHEEEEDKGHGSEYFIIQAEEDSEETYEEEIEEKSNRSDIVDDNQSEWSIAMNALSNDDPKLNPHHDKFIKHDSSSRINVDDLPIDSDTQINSKSAIHTNSLLVENINENTNSEKDQKSDNENEHQLDNENSQNLDKADDQKSQNEYEEDLADETDDEEEDQITKENADFDNYNPKNLSNQDNNGTINENISKEKLVLKRIVTIQSPKEVPTFNEFIDTSDTSSSDLDDLKNPPEKRLDLQTDSSSSLFKLSKEASGFSSEFEIKKESDFTSEEFEAFSTDSEQNYPTFAEVYKNLQQAKIDREKK